MPGRATPSVVEGVAAEAAVVGLDAADRGDQLPREVAARVGLVDDGLGALVGGQGGLRDAAGRAGRERRRRGVDRVAPTLAGASIAAVGRTVPSGSVPRAVGVGARRSRRPRRRGWRSTRRRAPRAGRCASLGAVGSNVDMSCDLPCGRRWLVHRCPLRARPHLVNERFVTPSYARSHLCARPTVTSGARAHRMGLALRAYVTMTR